MGGREDRFAAKVFFFKTEFSFSFSIVASFIKIQMRLNNMSDLGELTDMFHELRQEGIRLALRLFVAKDRC